MNTQEQRESLTHVMRHLLNDKTTSDFAIICRGDIRFHVHKLILSLRSEYFRRLLSRGNSFRENNDNELILTPQEAKNRPALIEDDDNPLLIYAFLKAIYTDTLITAATAASELSCEKSVTGSPEPIEFFGRLSMLGDRFGFKAMDNIIADNVFVYPTGLTVLSDSACNRTDSIERSGIDCRLRLDTPYVDTLLTVYINSVRNGSLHAAATIVNLVADYFHFIKQHPEIWEKLLACPNMQQALLKDLTEGWLRFMCCSCGVTFRMERFPAYNILVSANNVACANCSEESHLGHMMGMWNAGTGYVYDWKYCSSSKLRRKPA